MKERPDFELQWEHEKQRARERYAQRPEVIERRALRAAKDVALQEAWANRQAISLRWDQRRERELLRQRERRRASAGSPPGVDTLQE